MPQRGSSFTGRGPHEVGETKNLLETATANHPHPGQPD